MKLTAEYQLPNQVLSAKHLDTIEKQDEYFFSKLHSNLAESLKEFTAKEKLETHRGTTYNVSLHVYTQEQIKEIVNLLNESIRNCTDFEAKSSLVKQNIKNILAIL